MTALLAGLTGLSGAVPALAQSDERNKIGVPPSTIFKSMLRFAAEGEGLKLDRSLALLKPILNEHETAWGADALESLLLQIRGRNADKSQQAVLALVARDAVLLMRGVPMVPLDRARTLARTAALEWRIVEPSARDADPAAAAKVEGRFRELFEVVESGDTSAARTLVGRLEKEILDLFP